MADYHLQLVSFQFKFFRRLLTGNPSSSCCTPHVLYKIVPVDILILFFSFPLQEVTELRELRKLNPDLSVLFIRVPLLPETFSDDLPESEQHDILCKLRVLPSPVQADRSHHPAPIIPTTSQSRPQVPVQLFRTLCDDLGRYCRHIS